MPVVDFDFSLTEAYGVRDFEGGEEAGLSKMKTVQAEAENSTRQVKEAVHGFFIGRFIFTESVSG